MLINAVPQNKVKTTTITTAAKKKNTENKTLASFMSQLVNRIWTLFVENLDNLKPDLKFRFLSKLSGTEAQMRK